MTPALTRTVLTVMGMRNNTCRELLIQRLELIEGVRDVDISFHRATATISHTPSCRPGDLVWAIVHAGYGALLVSEDPVNTGSKATLDGVNGTK